MEYSTEGSKKTAEMFEVGSRITKSRGRNRDELDNIRRTEEVERGDFEKNLFLTETE